MVIYRFGYSMNSSHESLPHVLLGLTRSSLVLMTTVHKCVDFESVLAAWKKHFTHW